MTTGNVGIKENTSPTKKIATNTITEDGISKELGRSVLNNSSGVEITQWPVTQQGSWSFSLNNTNGLALDTSLVAMSGKLPASLGTKTSALSLSVTPSSDSGLSTSALQTTANTSLASIDGKFSSLGQKSSSASTPVVIASDQSALPSNLTQLAGVTLDSAGLPTRSHEDYERAGRVFNATTNPTPLTGTALHAVTAGYVNTAPSILIVAGAKPVTLKEILLKCTVAGAGGTTYQVIGVMDSVARYTSGGTLRSAKNNAFTDSTATLRVGTVAIVAAAPSASARVVFNPTIIKAAAPAVNDMYKLVFGQPESMYSVVVGNFTSSLPPITIPANGSLALHFISAVAWTTVPQFEGTIIFQE